MIAYLVSLLVQKAHAVGVFLCPFAHKEKRGLDIPLGQGIQKLLRVGAGSVVKGYGDKLVVPVFLRGGAEGQSRKEHYGHNDKNSSFLKNPLHFPLSPGKILPEKDRLIPFI